MTSLKERQIFDSFADKEYRDTYVAEHVSFGLAYQIRALREKYGWTQEELAERTGKRQETISQLENPDYGSYTLKTLKALASAFDVALLVSFVSFKELIGRIGNLTPELIAPPSYEKERQMSFAEVEGSSSIWVTGAGVSPSEFGSPLSIDYNILQVLAEYSYSVEDESVVTDTSKFATGEVLQDKEVVKTVTNISSFATANAATPQGEYINETA